MNDRPDMLDYTTLPARKQDRRWKSVLAFFVNAFTLWRCRMCRSRYPHWPLSGDRAAYAGDGVCRFCLEKHVAANDADFQQQCARKSRRLLR